MEISKVMVNSSSHNIFTTVEGDGAKKSNLKSNAE
jgi:hypothetical protein